MEPYHIKLEKLTKGKISKTTHRESKQKKGNNEDQRRKSMK